MSRVPSSCDSESVRCGWVRPWQWHYWYQAVMARGWHGLEQAPELPISGLPQAPVTLTGSKTSLPRAPTQVTLDLGHGEKTFKGFPCTMSFRASLSVCTWSWSHAGFPFPCSSFKIALLLLYRSKTPFTPCSLTTGVKTSPRHQRRMILKSILGKVSLRKEAGKKDSP